MSYTVYELFYSLQGEGRHAGRAAVFCRFSGCNLWNGREIDRPKSDCYFCDTQFVGMSKDGGKFSSPEQLAEHINALWGGQNGKKFVVFTGGEPLLQLDDALIDALHAREFEIAVESNGSIKAPLGIDWLCISPKSGGQFLQTSGDELKLVWPQKEFFELKPFETLNFKHFYLQPLDLKFLSDEDLNELFHTFNIQFPQVTHDHLNHELFNQLQNKITQFTIQTCLNSPLWRLSLQTHKINHIR